jgi:hypothetical protein
MALWLQALIAVSAFWIVAAVVGRRAGFHRLLHLWVAVFGLLALTLVLDAVGLRAAGWVALVLIVALFVLGASFAFGAGEAADSMLHRREVDGEPARH